MSDENKCPCFLAHTDSCKLSELENKFEEHLEDDSEEIRNELARQVELISENIEQIAKLKEELGNIKTNRNILEIHRHDLDEQREFLRELFDYLKKNDYMSGGYADALSNKLDVGSARQTERREIPVLDFLKDEPKQTVKTEKKDSEKNLCQHQRPNKRIGWECVNPKSENYKKECIFQRCPHKEDPLITIIKQKDSGARNR